MRQNMLTLLVLAAAGAGCSDAATGPGAFSGTYRYVALDGEGSTYQEGTLALKFHDDFAVTGNWTTTWGTGPAGGEGTVAGDLYRAGPGLSVTLNLEVSSTPNDMVVTGDMGNSYQGFTGTWTFTDYTGQTVGGRITAWRAR